MSDSEIYVTSADNPKRLVGDSTLLDAAEATAARFSPVEILKLLFSFPAMLGALLVGRVFYEGRAFFVDPDLWWHIKNGQNILATHNWPTTDPYSFTVAGTPWMAYEWLGDVIIASVAKFGFQALDALLIVSASVVLLALYYYATLRSGNSKAAFVAVVLLAPLAIVSFNLRPQMFGYLFLVLILIALELFRRGDSWALCALPPLLLIWVNTHGSWIIGLGVILVTLVTGLRSIRLGGVESQAWTQNQRLHLELALLGSVAVIPLTPYGTRLAMYPFLVASSLPINLANVKEWQSMPFGLIIGKLFLAIVGAFLIVQMLYRLTFRLSEWLLFLGGTMMACIHVRFVLLFVPFFAPLFAVLLARWIPGYERTKDKVLVNAALMAGVASAMIWAFPSTVSLEQTVRKDFPVGAVQYLREHPTSGNLFNSYGFGGYLVWALPEQKVFIDGRGDLYEVGGAFGDYSQLANLGPAAFFVLKSYNIRTCLLSREDPLATVLRELPDWRSVYADETSVVFIRKNPISVSEAAPPVVLKEN